jgi:gas vesicle protein
LHWEHGWNIKYSYEPKVEEIMPRNHSKWNHPVSALCIGLGVGAVLGILFAPKSGEETRDDIAGTVNDGIDEVRARAAKAARGARRFADQTREQVNEAIDAGTEAYRESLRSSG